MLRRLSLLLLTILLAGCATMPRYKGVAQGGNTANTLGLVVDERFQVVTVEPGSAAEKAGVQSGDVLVSLTWVLSEAPSELPATSGSAPTGTMPLTITVTPMRPPPGVENKTIPFSDDEGIRALIGYGVPLRLQLVRQDRVLQLTIIPAPSSGAGAPPSGQRQF